MYILITISSLYPDLVFNPDILTAALQEYLPLSDDCKECSVRDVVVIEPEVCALTMVMFFVVVRFPSGPVHTTSGITVSPLTAVTVHVITNSLPTIALSSGGELIWTVAQAWGTTC